MAHDDLMANLPDGYLKKRRKLNLFSIFTIYFFCIFKLTVNFKVINFADSNANMLITYLFYFLSIASLIVYYSNRTMYNKIKMFNHNEIKAFSRKEKTILVLPILLVAYFILFDLIYFLLLIGISYLAVDRFMKPVDQYDRANFGR